MFLIASTISGCVSDPENMEVETRSLSGVIELYDEFGAFISEGSSVEISLLNDQGESQSIANEQGEFELDYNDVSCFRFSKEGFGEVLLSKKEIQDRSFLTIWMSEVSAMEVSNLQVQDTECGLLPCYAFSFYTKNFYTNETNKRYFEIEVQDVFDEVLGALRFFVFTEPEKPDPNTVEPINLIEATVRVDRTDFPFLQDVLSGSQLSLSLYAVTSNTFTKISSNIS